MSGDGASKDGASEEVAAEVEASAETPATSTARPVTSWLAGLILAVLAATGLYGAGFWIFRDRGPGKEAIASAAGALRSRFEPGDAIFLVPFYATRAREWLGDLDPVAVPDPLSEDLESRSRLWVFGLFEEAELLRPRMRLAGFSLAETVGDHAGVVVDLYLQDRPAKDVYDFRDRLAEAVVYHEKDGQRTLCSQWSSDGRVRGRGRWQCPTDRDWFYVGPEWHRMGPRLRLCLWAHPPREGRLVISYPRVPLAGSIYGRAGHTLLAAANRRPPIWLDVHVGHLIPQRFEIDSSDSDRPFMLATPRVGSATVAFAVSTSDNGANHFCFEALVRQAPSRGAL